MTTATARAAVGATGFLGAVLAAMIACSPPTEPSLPDIVLITLDTTRADRLGSYGNASIRTPNLDRLAAEGVRFENAFTPVPSTLPSHSSIMTGLHPARHGVHDNGVYRLDPALPTLAKTLRESGYSTGAFVSAYVLDRRFGLETGFDVYDDEMELPLQERQSGAGLDGSDRPEPARQWLLRQAAPFQRRANRVTERAVEWLRSQANQPVFLWVHYFDPHMSYEASEPWALAYDSSYDGRLDGTMSTFMRMAGEDSITRRDLEHMIARYDGEISFMDHSIGDLFAELETLGRFDESLVVVVGDHGEGFGEHGQYWEHNGQIFDEVMRVPLIVRRPGAAGAGSVDSSLTSTLDVAPTILSTAGLAGWEETQGRRLFSDSQPDPERRLLFEALRERQITEMPHSWIGLRGSKYKLITNLDSDNEITRSGFYDLEVDPGEHNSAHSELPAELEEWEREALSTYSKLRAESPPSAGQAIDPTTQEALEALGYLD